MVCPHCQSDEGSSVIDSRDHYDVRRRRHQCKACDKRYSTYEISAAEYEKIGAVSINVSHFDSVIAALRAIKTRFGDPNGTAKN